MRRYLTILSIVILFASCSKDKNSDTPIYLEEAKKTGGVSKELLKQALIQQGLEAYASLPQSAITTYAVTYKTKYPSDKTITASGVFIVPANVNTSFPLVVYTHGTITEDDAPSLKTASIFQYSQDVFLATLIASSFNCIVLLPDYIGYNASANITHPYIHGPSLAQASIDLIQAYREFAFMNSLPFRKDLFITGYSEGGYAAVAVQKAVQELYGSNLFIEKTVAGSGPYDNVSFAKAFLAKDTILGIYEVGSYLWAIDMFKRDYNYSKSYSDIFSEEDNQILRNDNYDLGYFHPSYLPIHTNPKKLFNPAFINGILDNSDTEFLEATRQNSLMDFTPTDSLIFVYGAADTWVYPINTLNAYNAMSAKGCKVAIYEDPEGDHYTTMNLYLQVLLNSLTEVKNRKAAVDPEPQPYEPIAKK